MCGFLARLRVQLACNAVKDGSPMPDFGAVGPTRSSVVKRRPADLPMRHHGAAWAQPPPHSPLDLTERHELVVGWAVLDVGWRS